MKSIIERAIEKAKWTITKFEFTPAIREAAEADMRAGMSKEAIMAKYKGNYKFLGEVEFGPNMLLNEGINALLTLGAGGAETAFNNANARLGVGDSSVAEAATQIDLQAAVNKLYKAMDASYPTYGTNQQLVFRSTFGGTDANYAWAEFSVDNGAVALKNLNRKVSAQGTKTSGQSWQLTLTITIS